MVHNVYQNFMTVDSQQDQLMAQVRERIEYNHSPASGSNIDDDLLWQAVSSREDLLL